MRKKVFQAFASTMIIASLITPITANASDTDDTKPKIDWSKVYIPDPTIKTGTVIDGNGKLLQKDKNRSASWWGNETCYAPAGIETTCTSSYSVFGSRGLKVGYAWSVSMMTFTSVIVRAKGYENHREKWFSAGAGEDGKVDVPWGEVAARKQIKVKSAGAPAGATVYW
ncbi:hypothetical protein BK816_08185 [Boudabousia tangfeifanii]|uniref:Uncharacterized protein n=1 Tax=Boudabousia tangfeifanii TaxID=1912795 RepID=A0A1D9MLT5_9ACTO|nr:hypothetical protein [Boudabousia tangfeifanii]AOZ73264.1 hypothetical protein BK816_08185 [Boudabousia tangfeifanii]